MSELEPRVRRLERRNTVLAVAAALSLLLAAGSWLSVPRAVADQKDKPQVTAFDMVKANAVVTDKLKASDWIVVDSADKASRVRIVATNAKTGKPTPAIMLDSPDMNLFIDHNGISMGTPRSKSYVLLDLDPKTKEFRLTICDKDGKVAFVAPKQ